MPAILEKPGDLVGRYKLLERIGEGGFGVVYMAEQQDLCGLTSRLLGTNHGPKGSHQSKSTFGNHLIT